MFYNATWLTWQYLRWRCEAVGIEWNFLHKSYGYLCLSLQHTIVQYLVLGEQHWSGQVQPCTFRGSARTCPDST
jgi:hypothetical protein